MGFYDYECDLIRADERFICQCMKCGQERLKKLSVCMLRREGSGIVKLSATSVRSATHSRWTSGQCRNELKKEVRRVGDVVLYAAVVVGAWTAASATITLAESLGKKKDRLSGGAEKRSGQIKSAE